MNSARKQIALLQIAIFFVLITSFTQTAQSKSVYAIIDHPLDIIGAYKIQGNQIIFQEQIQAPQHATRAIDLAIDSNSSCIFVTYEGSNIIEIMNAKTLQNEGSVTAIGASNLAGIVFDEARQKLYTVDRGTDKLFVYFWNSSTKTLTPDGTNPKILTELSFPSGDGAYGIALDTFNGYLHVTNYTSTIHYYDTNNWSHLGDVNVGQTAVDVDIDSDRRYLYAGGYRANTYLVKFDLSTGIAEANDIGAGVIGLAVDPETGFIYTTTYHNQLRVYNTATSPFNLTDYENISAGCGVTVPSSEVSYKPPLFYLKKVDVNEPNSVLPDDFITYEITYGPGGAEHDNVRLVDYLPNEVDYPNLFDPNYDIFRHTYTWFIGSLDSDDPCDSVTLKVKVNEGAEPNGTITNYCEIESDSACSYATAYTNVGSWQPDSEIIYVDSLSPCVPGTGMSWRFAYRDLQDALQRAGDGYGSEIWVAEGTYYTHIDTDSAYWDVNFGLVSGVGLYGGFAGNETFRSRRNWLANETILEGNIPGGSADSDTSWIITAVDCNSSTIVDGFTIKNGYSSSIKINGGSPTIRNSIITSAYGGDGIECIGQPSPKSSPNITKCKICNNSSGSGIKIGEGGEHPSSPTISYCLIMNNGNGISNYSNDGSSPVITNNWICGNDYDGIHLISTSDDIVFRNNTVANNDCGIRMDSYADITNCIVWGNGGSLHWSDNEVSYSCVQGGYTGTGNIADDPCFVDDADDNYHLSPDSPCIDKGNTSLIIDSNETDIDGESRVLDGDANGTDLVDMGADEFYWSPADFDRNELVNFLDYAVLASAWLMQAGDGAYNEDCDLEDDNTIDYDDLGLFCKDWLWQSAWNQSNPLMKMMGFGFGGGDGLLYAASSPEQPQPQELSEEQYLEETKRAIEIVESFRSQILDDEQMKQEYEDAWQGILDMLDDWLKELEDQL